MILHLRLLPERFAIARLPAGAAIPDWAARGSFLSITRTADELSIVAEEGRVPPECVAARDWRCLALEGTFALTAIGIAAELTAALAKARVSVFVVSTFDTDYVLVAASQLDRAVNSLAAAGHTVAR